MKVRALALAALLPLSMLAACDNDDDDTTGPSNDTATVRFVNATGTNLDVATNGTVGTGNGNLAFGTSSSCMTVNAASTGLTVRNAGSTTPLAGFTPAFTTGGNYTVIAYPGAGGTTQFATLSGTFTPASGQAGLRVFNAASGSGSFDTYVTTPGATLGTASATATAFGGNSVYFNVPSGSQQVRFTNAGTQTVGVNAGNNTFVAGQNSTIVIAPAATGSTTLRTFYVGGC